MSGCGEINRPRIIIGEFACETRFRQGKFLPHGFKHVDKRGTRCGILVRRQEYEFARITEVKLKPFPQRRFINFQRCGIVKMPAGFLSGVVPLE